MNQIQDGFEQNNIKKNIVLASYFLMRYSYCNKCEYQFKFGKDEEGIINLCEGVYKNISQASWK